MRHWFKSNWVTLVIAVTIAFEGCASLYFGTEEEPAPTDIIFGLILGMPFAMVFAMVRSPRSFFEQCKRLFFGTVYGSLLAATFIFLILSYSEGFAFESLSASFFLGIMAAVFGFIGSTFWVFLFGCFINLFQNKTPQAKDLHEVFE
jgi:hypothetical protein